MSFGEPYVAYPDLLPARATGTPWGEETIDLEHVGGPYRVAGVNTLQVRQISWRRRRGEGVRPARPFGRIDIRVFMANDVVFTEFEPPPYWEYQFDIDYEGRSIRLAGHRFAARLDWAPLPTATIWTAFGQGEEFSLVFENVLRVLAAFRVFEQGGLMLHSSCVVDDGEAWLFLGESGAGKSTVARRSLDAKMTVLSDDLNVVSPLSVGLAVERVPFAGEFAEELHDRPGSAAQVPLAGIVTLDKGTRTRAQPGSTARAVAALVGSALSVNAHPDLSEDLFVRASQIAHATRFRMLEFCLDEDFWPILRQSKVTV